MQKNTFSVKKNKFLGSLYQWALVRFIFVSLPLIAAVLYTAVEVTKYTQKNQHALFRMVNATENSRSILERLTSMERSIRQFQVLHEPDLLMSYHEHREKLVNIIGALKIIELNQSFIDRLIALQINEHELYEKIILSTEENAQIKDEEMDLKTFDQLTKQARALIEEGEESVGVEASTLSLSTQQIGEKLIYAAIASIPIALIIGFIFIYLLIRPIKEIAQAIRNLGEVGFDQSIVIQGPQELTELGAHLEWLRQRLSRLEFEKQQFIRNVSHELKTPLATLKEGTDLLAENVVGELNTEQHEIIQLMEIGNITINGLIDNLLEYQRSISTETSLNLSTFKLETLIERIVNEYKLPLRSKKVKVKTSLEKVSINADYDKLRVIISNVFSNALKFSPENGTIGLTLLSQNKETIITVEDQGPGIEKEIENLIFENYYLGSPPQSWKIKGSGIGLALVRHYLEIHNGTIILLQSNNPYHGARFSLQLPDNINH